MASEIIKASSVKDLVIATDAYLQAHPTFEPVGNPLFLGAGQGYIWAVAETITGSVVVQLTPGSNSEISEVASEVAADDLPVLPANADRKRVIVFNNTDRVAYLSLSDSANTTNNFTVKIQPDGSYENADYSGEVTCAFAEIPTGSLLVTEITI